MLSLVLPISTATDAVKLDVNANITSDTISLVMLVVAPLVTTKVGQSLLYLNPLLPSWSIIVIAVTGIVFSVTKAAPKRQSRSVTKATNS